MRNREGRLSKENNSIELTDQMHGFRLEFRAQQAQPVEICLNPAEAFVLFDKLAEKLMDHLARHYVEVGERDESRRLLEAAGEAFRQYQSGTATTELARAQADAIEEFLTDGCRNSPPRRSAFGSHG